MNTGKMRTIEVDEEVYQYLQKNAEPFIDTTPNSVLRRYLPLENILTKPLIHNDIPEFRPGVPSALEQILQVIYLVRNKGYDRRRATRKVADLRGITYQAVIDKYTRQLGKEALQVDELLMDSNIDQFKMLLIKQFPYHKKVIEGVFSGVKDKSE